MEFSANKQGEREPGMDKGEREIRMDTRNEMCRANCEEGTTGYGN
jgi:hypothetical protein